MRAYRTRTALLGIALACWGCLSVPPPPGVFSAESTRPRVPVASERTRSDAGRQTEPLPGLPEAVWIKPRRQWRYIVLHHSATTVGGADRFDRHHRTVRKWENGLGYHFVIGNGTDTPDGHIEAGSRWLRQIAGAHAGVTRFNELGIGICLVGDFRGHGPSHRQQAALRRLVEVLRSRCAISRRNVVGHGDIRPGTKCPGTHFPTTLAFEP